MLVDGKWTAKWDPVQAKDQKGGFVRQPSSFRHWVTPDGAPGPTGEGGFEAEPGRYHLYVGYICPWACRTLMVRALKKLEDVISVSVVNPSLTDFGWRFGAFPGSTEDPIAGAEYLYQIYVKADPTFTGRATVPVLWDKKRETIVNNESADLVRMLGSAFDAVGDASVDLYPEDLRAEIDALAPLLYHKINNGAYKSGFASTQESYEEAVVELFAALDQMEERLSDGRAYLCGDRLTEADIRLFVTLIRFDAAYVGLFKCNLRRIADYPHLQAHTERMMAIPEIAGTVRMDHIKAGYYSIKALNPTGVIPVGPLPARAA